MPKTNLPETNVPETSGVNNAFNADNLLLRSVKRARKLPDLVTIAFVSTLFMVIGGEMLGGFLANHVTQISFSRLNVTGSAFYFSVYQTVWLLVSALPVLILLWNWTKFYERRNVLTLGLSLENAIVKILLGAAIAVCMTGLSLLVLKVAGLVEFKPGTVFTKGNGGVLSATIPFIGLTVRAFVQELIFRGWLLPVIGYRYNWKLGVGLSALLYGAFHIFIFQNPIDVLNLSLLGVFLGLYALQEGSIWGAVAFQSVWLWANSNLLGFPLQTQLPINSIFFAVQPNKPFWLSGGDVGLRGSAVLTVILVLVSAGLWAFNYQRVGRYARPDSLAAAGQLRERKARALRRRVRKERSD